ncbi:MAG TPA: hypothetical protein PKM88_06920 [bacterium]|nr:hypothetical protein [bacterium]
MTDKQPASAGSGRAARWLAGAAPLLLALYPLAHIAAGNWSLLDPGVMLCLALLLGLLTAAGQLAAGRFLRDRAAGQCWLALALGWLALYPAFRAGCTGVWPALTPAAIAAAHGASGLLLLLLAVWRLRRPTPSAAAFAAIAGAVGALLLGTLLIAMLFDWWGRQRDFAATCDAFTVPVPATAPAAAAPDITLLILDEYARADTLRRLFAGDNEPFIAALRARGFTVPDLARANYNQTMLTLASALNLAYLPPLADRGDNWPVARLVRHSRLAALLAARNYLIRDCAGGYAGVALNPPSLAANILYHHQDMLLAWLDLTPASALVDSLLRPQSVQGHALRAATRAAFARAALPPDPQQPTFTFVHCVVTHQPLVFAADGGWPEATDTAGQYRGAVAHANRLVLELADRCRRQAIRPQVMVIMSDHGTGTRLDWASPVRTDLDERFGTINAVWYSSGNYAARPAALTPVNTLRRIASDWLGADCPPLPEQSFFSTLKQPYHFTDITEHLL